MKYDFFLPFHVTPTANGWGIDEHDKFARTIRYHIVEFDDRSFADYVCDKLNVWAKDKLYDLETNEELDGFCNDIYNAEYYRGTKDERFYME